MPRLGAIRSQQVIVRTGLRSILREPKKSCLHGPTMSSPMWVPTSAATRSWRPAWSVAIRWRSNPDPLTAAEFERNISLNRIADLVEIRITAVGERQGIVRFSTGLDTENHLVAEIEPRRRDVPIETLDHAFAETGRIPALIKLDVEGMKPRCCGALGPF
jgi:hypothetical protein